MKFHIKIQEKTYEVQLGDVRTRPIQVEVDGEIFEVWPQELILPPAGESPAPVQKITHPVLPVEDSDDKASKSLKPDNVLAPIPGVIVEIHVSVGDEVIYGQELCVLEAMKMKNAIRSIRKGVIKKIHITMGDQVQQSQILFSFKEA